MPAEDDILLAEEEPLPVAASPTTKSPGYIDESDPDEDPEEDPTNYLVDGGDEGDDEDESSDEDEDDDVDIEGMRRRMRESSVVARARLGEPIKDDLYRFVDIVEQGKGSTPAAMEVGYGITDAWDDLVGAIQEIALTIVEGVNQRKEIKELGASDRKLQAYFIQALTAQKSCQTQLTVALGRNQILEAARVPTQPVKMAPKSTTNLTPATTTTTTTTPVTNAQLKVIDGQPAQHAAVSTSVGDYRIAGSRPYTTDTTSRGTDSAKDTADTDGSIAEIKMAPKSTTNLTPATTTTTTTTPVTNAQLKVLIDQGIANALATCDTDRSQKCEDNHDS
nr:hypothetical protein [Tanacetum cinerariifolium]